jgi:hypothetical protein
MFTRYSMNFFDLLFTCLKSRCRLQNGAENGKKEADRPCLRSGRTCTRKRKSGSTEQQVDSALRSVIIVRVHAWIPPSAAPRRSSRQPALEAEGEGDLHMASSLDRLLRSSLCGN